MYSQKLANEAKAFLDSFKVPYEFDEEKGILTYDAGVRNKIEMVFMRVYFFENGFLNRTCLFPGVFPKTDRKREVIEFLTRANNGLHDGNFEMDFNELDDFHRYEIGFKQVLYCDTDQVELIEVGNALFKSMIIADVYGDALLDVMNGNDTPKHAVEEAEKKMKEMKAGDQKEE